MNKHKLTTEMKRDRRRVRIRSRITGTAARPRLSVHRSLTGMYAQLIDDVNSKTLASVHSKVVDAKKIDAAERSGKIAIAYAVGKLLAEKAKELKIETVVFDRGGFAYHGRVEAVADGARDGGLQF